MNRIRILILCILIFISQIASAQQKWNFSGQIRHRLELSGKDFNNDTDFNNFHLLRSRFNAGFSNGANIEALIQAQDSRYFGEESNTLIDGSADNLDIHQAYVRIKRMFDLPIDMKLGRMEVIYGSQRLIGAVGWHNIGRSLDGIIFTYKTGRSAIDVFNFKENENLQNSDEADQNIMGIYGNIKPSDYTTIQPYLIWQKKHPSNQLDRKTIGIYSAGSYRNFTYETEIAFQSGDAASKDTRAYLAAFTAGYKFSKSTLKPVIAAGIDYLSGDEDTGDNTIRVFDTMYATNHKFYGFMDYFLNIPANTLGLGLRDYFIKLSTDLNKKIRFAADVHIFNADKEYMLSGDGKSTRFGTELDLTLSHRYDKNINFTGGVSLFTPGDIFKETRDSDTSTWIYLMTVVNLK